MMVYAGCRLHLYLCTPSELIFWSMNVMKNCANFSYIKIPSTETSVPLWFMFKSQYHSYDLKGHENSEPTDLYDTQVLQHNIARLITVFSKMRWTNVKAIHLKLNRKSMLKFNLVWIFSNTIHSNNIIVVFLMEETLNPPTAQFIKRKRYDQNGSLSFKSRLFFVKYNHITS